MPASLSIKNVPDEVLERLRERAQRNHRSLQGELMAILEEAAMNPQPQKNKTMAEAYERTKQLNFRTPSDSTAIIRELRDGRS